MQLEIFKKLEFLKMKTLKHSGCGPNPIHVQVMNAFRESLEEGKRFCEEKGYKHEIKNSLLRVWGQGNYAFQFSALVKQN